MHLLARCQRSRAGDWAWWKRVTWWRPSPADGGSVPSSSSQAGCRSGRRTQTREPREQDWSSPRHCVASSPPMQAPPDPRDHRINQGCRSGSALIWVAGSGSGSRKAKPTNKEKSKEFSCFNVLDVLFWRLKAFPVLVLSVWRPIFCNFFIKKIWIFCWALNFFRFLVIKTLDSELDPDLDLDPQLGKNLDPDPYPDPH